MRPPSPRPPSRARRGVVDAFLGPDEGPCLHLWRLIHRVMRTAGNGVTFAEGREDNAVTPDQSRSEHNQTLSGRLSISFLLHNTADTLYPSSSAFSPTSISRDGSSTRRSSARVAHRSGRFPLVRLPSSVPSRPWSGEHARRQHLCIMDRVEIIDSEDHLLPDGIIAPPVFVPPR